MNVLIVSYCFAPQNAIGAVRATKLAKYLTRMGYSVTVIGGKGLDAMQDPILARDLEALRDVHIVRERSLLRRWKERGQAEKTEKSDIGVATAPTPARTGWKPAACRWPNMAIEAFPAKAERRMCWSNWA